jgi:putative oxidoreductase
MSTSYVIPQLAELYAALSPVVEAVLRIAIGLCLVPHGLRTYFGMFPNTGMPINSLPMLVDVLDREGYRPGRVWGPVIVITELIGGPLLALGLFTRLVSIPVFILLALSAWEHRKTGWFWNTQGIEYPLIWALGSLYFLVHGGGTLSLDHLIGCQF